MKSYLVTGGAGFIGSNFIIFILKKYNDKKIINVDKLTYAGNLENIKEVENNPNYKFINADICDKEVVNKIFKENDVDYVVNFAAESHVDRSIIDPEIFIKTNILGTTNLLNTARDAWKTKEGFKIGKKYLQISTDEVYGSLGDGEEGFTENTPLDPHSPYSASKASADLIVKSYYDTYKMPINITRSSNNYGPYQFPEKLIPLIINNCLNKKPIPVYGDGLNIRDWIYVEDHYRAIDLVIEKGETGKVYNIGSQNEKTNIYIIKTIIKFMNENVDATITEELIKYTEDRKGHDRRYGIDSSNIQNKLGWKPEIAFEEGIEKTIKWYLQNVIWLNNVTSGEYQNYYKKMYKSI